MPLSMEVPNMNVDYFESLYNTFNVNSMELLSDFSPIPKLESNTTDLLDLPTGSCLGQSMSTGSYPPQYSSNAFGSNSFGECESLLTAAADTLNNYGAAAYHNSLDSSFEGLHPPPAASSPYLGMKQETSFSTPCGSPFSARTPVPPPLSDTDVLPMDEPSQLLQLKELSIRSSDIISNNCITSKQHLPYTSEYEQLLHQQTPSSLYALNSNNSFSESQLSPKQNYISSPLNSIHDSSCSWQTPSDMYSLPQSQNDDPSSSWQVPENCLQSPHPSTQYSLDITHPEDTTWHNTSFLSSHESYSPNLNQRSPMSGDSSMGGDACSYADDPLNIPREQLLPFINVDQSIQQLIGAECASGSGIADTSGHSVAADPRLWSRDDIRIWLEWACKEFNLKRKIVADMLPSTGAELCCLSKQQLQQRVGDEDGDKLANYLQCGLTGYGESLPEDQPNLDPYEKYSSTCIRLSCPGSGQIQLWQFLLELLADRTNAQVITWDNSSSEFKILQPDEVARKWGERKTKPNMNYDKLSRALRYYYDRGLMVKVPGKRYAYRACFPALEALHASQQGTEPKPAVDYELFHTINSSLRSSDTPSPYR